MIPGLNTFLDRFESLLGKSYVIVGFFPVFVFFLFCLLVLSLLVPETVADFLSAVSEEATLDQTLTWLALLFAIVLAGYVFWSLNSWFREFLEGAYIPPPLRRWLEARQQDAKSELRNRLRTLNAERFGYRRHAGMELHDAMQDPLEDPVKERQWITALLRAGEPAERPAKGVRPLGYTSLPEIRSAYAQMKAALAKRRMVPFADALELFDMLRDELEERGKPAAPPAGGATSRPALDAGAQTLDDIAADFPRLARAACILVDTEGARVQSEMFFRFPDDSTTLGPTAMANMASLHRGYGKKRYGMEVDLIWPRMQKLIAADSDFSGFLAENKTKLDFAVSMTAVSVIFALAWTVPVALLSGGAWLVLAVPAVSLIAAVLFYLAAVRAYRAFGEILRSAIDTFRFKLLDELNLSRPVDSDDEKKIWQSLSAHIMLRPREVLSYKTADAGDGG